MGSGLSQLTMSGTEVSQRLTGAAFGKHGRDCRCRAFLALTPASSAIFTVSWTLSLSWDAGDLLSSTWSRFC